MKFSGKTVLITGAARGQGREHALGFAREGANVVVNDVCRNDSTVQYKLSDKTQMDKTVRDVKRHGVKAVGIDADISDAKQVNSMVKEALDAFGKIDVLVNNAGIVAGWYPVVELPEEVWDRAIAVNLKGTFLVTKAVLPSMIKRKSGRIINISSVGGLIGFEGSSHYVASKHGVIGLTKCLAQEVGKYNITVNAICPGRVATTMTLDMIKKSSGFIDSAESMSVFPDRPMIEPSDITSAVLWLASDEARNVTGSSLVIDQGHTSR